jgi:hypothetical protein
VLVVEAAGASGDEKRRPATADQPGTVTALIANV